jgi:hypothetical protein
LLPGVGHEDGRVRDGVACAVFQHEVLDVLVRLQLVEDRADPFAGLRKYASAVEKLEGKRRTWSSETHSVETALAYIQIISFMKSSRSSSRSWLASQKSFQSFSHAGIISSTVLVKLAKSFSFAWTVCWALRSFSWRRSTSLPGLTAICCVYDAMRRQSLSYFSRAFRTYDSWVCLVLNLFSSGVCRFFR